MSSSTSKKSQLWSQETLSTPASDNESDSPKTNDGVKLGERCQFLASWFDEKEKIIDSQLEALAKYSNPALVEKISQIEDWAFAIGIEESREMSRTKDFNVLKE
mmetsp:Transcript_13033/g.22279  ORF Transcript_13033/g.22279 Transcript_13033/m.22279 type:complete len:104 (+) Transcript_13033:34-345(+)